MDKQKLDRANELNSFIEYYQTTINRYCNDIGNVEGSRLGNALLNIVKYAPHEADNIKSAIAKAFDSIQKQQLSEFQSSSRKI